MQILWIVLLVGATCWPMAAGDAKGLLIRGSSTMAEVMSSKIKSFGSSKIRDGKYDEQGSWAGIKCVLQATCDVGVSIVPIPTDQWVEGILTIPVVVGGITVAHNVPGLSSRLRLGACDLARIYTGKVTTWGDDSILASQTRGLTGLRNGTIIPFARAGSSGSSEIFTKYLKAACPEVWTAEGSGTPDWGPAVQVNESTNDGVLTDVLTIDNSIGYAVCQLPEHNEAAIEGADGTFMTAISPKFGSINNIELKGPDADWSNADFIYKEGMFPTAFVGYLLVNRNRVSQGTVDFIQFALSDKAQDKLKDYRFGHLSGNLTIIARQAVDILVADLDKSTLPPARRCCPGCIGCPMTPHAVGSKGSDVSETKIIVPVVVGVFALVLVGALILRIRKPQIFPCFQFGGCSCLPCGCKPEPSDASRSQELHGIIGRGRSPLDDAKYNKAMLEFLCGWMEEIGSLEEVPIHMSCEIIDCWHGLKRALENGERLVRRHAAEFKLEEFYSIDEARCLIETLCTNIRDCFRSFQASYFLPREVNVPQCAVDSDREFLEHHLGFVFGKTDPKLDDSFLQEWHAVRDSLRANLANIRTIERSEIVFREQIAKGAYGEVFKANWGEKVVAVKDLMLEQGHNINQQLAIFHVEAAVHAAVHHEHIVPVYAMSNCGLLVMELADSNLKGWLDGQRTLTWEQKIHVLHQAASGLDHLHHSRSLIHRDVKSNNFLVFYRDLEEGPIVKLCDFGIALRQTEQDRERTLASTLRKQPGTPLYLAPELADGKPHSFASDVFSFGVVMYEVAAQSMAYAGSNEYAIMDRKKKGEPPCPIPHGCSKELRNLMGRCISAEPRKRPTMQVVVRELRFMTRKSEVMPTDWACFPAFGWKRCIISSDSHWNRRDEHFENIAE